MEKQEKFKKKWNIIDYTAKNWAYLQEGADVMVYPCGFASIKFQKNINKDQFGQWLIENKIVSLDPDGKGYQLWVGFFNQSLQHKEAYAEKVVEMLETLVWTEDEDPKVRTWSKLD